MAEDKTGPEPIPTYTVPAPRDAKLDELGRPLIDVKDHQNPNGIVVAEISAKFPKAGGETRQEVLDDGRILEKSVGEDPALATAAGGIEGAEEGTAPGPKPQASGGAGDRAGALAASTATGKEAEKVAEGVKSGDATKEGPQQMTLNRQDAEKQAAKK